MPARTDKDLTVCFRSPSSGLPTVRSKVGAYIEFEYIFHMPPFSEYWKRFAWYVFRLWFPPKARPGRIIFFKAGPQCERPVRAESLPVLVRHQALRITSSPPAIGECHDRERSSRTCSPQRPKRKYTCTLSPADDTTWLFRRNRIRIKRDPAMPCLRAECRPSHMSQRPAK